MFKKVSSYEASIGIVMNRHRSTCLDQCKAPGHRFNN